MNVLYHPPDHEGPILFSYRPKVFFGKKRASLRVENGEWSDKFSLDAAGSTGVVECKFESLKYEVNCHFPFPISRAINRRLIFLVTDCRSQHLDAQFADKTNYIYAVLRSDEQSTVHDTSARR